MTENPMHVIAEALGLTVEQVGAMTWADLQNARAVQLAELDQLDAEIKDIDQELGRRVVDAAEDITKKETNDE